MAPMMTGSIEISENQDNTITVNINTFDDRGNNITGTWTGEYELYEGMSRPSGVRIADKSNYAGAYAFAKR